MKKQRKWRPLARFLGAYGVKTQNELISKILRDFEKKSVPRQWRSRRIIQFQTVKTLTAATNFYTPGEKYACAGIDILPEGFCIILRKGRKREWDEDIGHELGHTLFFNLAKSPPDPAWRTFEESEEDFCERFGKRWAKQFGPELQALLQEHGSTEEKLNRILKRKQ